MIWNLCFISYVFLFLCLFVGFGFCAQDIESNDINEGRKYFVETSSEEGSTSVKPAVTKPPIQEFVCPSRQTRIPFFAPSCRNTKDCAILGPGFLCCYARCIRGVIPPKPEPIHSPLFGVIDRVCPEDPTPELLAVQECIVDEDCGPRICCPERPSQGKSAKNYCRNAAPRFTRMPAIRQMLLPLKSFMSYLQCSPPPPPFLDLFPKPCESPFDCFPSLCCQENGKKFCRPPKRSMLALIAGAAQTGYICTCQKFHSANFMMEMKSQLSGINWSSEQINLLHVCCRRCL